jgi:hypothetical protein
MRSLSFALVLAFVASGAAAAQPEGVATGSEQPAERSTKKSRSDAQIKKLLIDESIAAYPGNCPCPYSRARNGSRCGKRSAYSREAGAAPLCYPSDVTAEMVQTYRDEHADE